MRQSLLKNVVRVLVAALVAYFLVTSLPSLRRNVSKRDSIAYWSAARLLLSGEDPYNPDTVYELELTQGYRDEKPLVLRTPPWSLFMVLPLGWMSAFWAWVAWVALSLGSFVCAMHLCWRLFGNAAVPPRFFWLIGYLFAPVPACLVSGQMGLLLLLGVVLFLWLEPRHPYLAGVVLILPFAKPHLLVLFWLILALWILSKKRWPVLIGLAAAFVATTALAIALRPNIFLNYRQMLNRLPLRQESWDY